MMRSVRTRFVILCLVATVLIAAPVSVADQTQNAGKTDPASTRAPASKAAETVFTDGFETGDTSLWSNGTANNDCISSLVFPTELAD